MGSEFQPEVDQADCSSAARSEPAVITVFEALPAAMLSSKALRLTGKTLCLNLYLRLPVRLTRSHSGRRLRVRLPAEVTEAGAEPGRLQGRGLVRWRLRLLVS